MTVDASRVNIRPEVSVLSLFRHLNYKPWYALAEFVDNALQSYLTHREALHALEGDNFRFKVEVMISQSDDRIVIRDNAAGIAMADYGRAFKTASPPPDRTGLSQFGVGMKSAACWFAKRWTVRTSALGEPTSRVISFNVDDIVLRGIDELYPLDTAAASTDHYTELTLSGINHPPYGQTFGKIKRHLAGIYRFFLKRDMDLWMNNELLSFQEPAILTAPYFSDMDGLPIRWIKQIDITLTGDRRIWGWAGILQTASVRRAGFALFKHDRLIQGSDDETWRPPDIFGDSNGYRYQRLVGELTLDGFDVTHTKDGFQWDGDVDHTVAVLRAALDTDPVPLLRQAAGYRVRASQAELRRNSEDALAATARVIQDNAAPLIAQQHESSVPASLDTPAELSSVGAVSRREIDIDLSDIHLRIVLETTTDPSVGDWLELSDDPAPSPASGGRQTIGARLSLAHPFMDRFAGTAEDRIEPLLRVAAAIALAETAARSAGARQVGLVRRFVNELLRGPLARP